MSFESSCAVARVSGSQVCSASRVSPLMTWHSWQAHFSQSPHFHWVLRKPRQFSSGHLRPLETVLLAITSPPFLSWISRLDLLLIMASCCSLSSVISALRASLALSSSTAPIVAGNKAFSLSTHLGVHIFPLLTDPSVGEGIDHEFASPFFLAISVHTEGRFLVKNVVLAAGGASSERAILASNRGSFRVGKIFGTDEAALIHI